ncbi:MAG: hypothetical protein PHE83_11460 [Opitutaceae bacterium]|nr:hypothetical protein [Opitutaceae bacterium]
MRTWRCSCSAAIRPPITTRSARVGGSIGSCCAAASLRGGNWPPAAGVLQVGAITVAIDGTKGPANARRHSALSYGRARAHLRQVAWAIEPLLAEADAAPPLPDGLSLEGELARRPERKARRQQARAEIAARAWARAPQERARQAPAQPGPPAPPTPAATNPSHDPDPQRRIMPAGGKLRFEPSANAPAAVAVESRLIVGQLCRPGDQRPGAVGADAQRAAPRRPRAVKEGLTDRGFCRAAAVDRIEYPDDGQPTGITVLAAVGRKAHSRTGADREQPAAPPAPAASRNAGRPATATGRTRDQ